MFIHLRDARKRVVGLKQVLRGIESGKINRIALADDVDARFEKNVLESCARYCVAVERGCTMRELGKICSMDVPSAVAGWHSED